MVMTGVCEVEIDGEGEGKVARYPDGWEVAVV